MYDHRVKKHAHPEPGSSHSEASSTHGSHASHPQVINRLKRANGHLQLVIDMMSEQRPCLAIAQQLQAVERAIVAAKKALIHDHLDHCLDDAVAGGPEDSREMLDEFRHITKYL